MEEDTGAVTEVTIATDQAHTTPRFSFPPATLAGAMTRTLIATTITIVVPTMIRICADITQLATVHLWFTACLIHTVGALVDATSHHLAASHTCQFQITATVNRLIATATLGGRNKSANNQSATGTCMAAGRAGITHTSTQRAATADFQRNHHPASVKADLPDARKQEVAIMRQSPHLGITETPHNAHNWESHASAALRPSKKAKSRHNPAAKANQATSPRQAKTIASAVTAKIQPSRLPFASRRSRSARRRSSVIRGRSNQRPTSQPAIPPPKWHA